MTLSPQNRSAKFCIINYFCFVVQKTWNFVLLINVAEYATTPIPSAPQKKEVDVANDTLIECELQKLTSQSYARIQSTSFYSKLKYHLKSFVVTNPRLLSLFLLYKSIWPRVFAIIDMYTDIQRLYIVIFIISFIFIIFICYFMVC